MTADNEIEIKEAFQRAQKGHNNKAKLVVSLNSRYNKVSAASHRGYFLFYRQKYIFVYKVGSGK